MSAEYFSSSDAFSEIELLNELDLILDQAINTQQKPELHLGNASLRALDIYSFGINADISDVLSANYIYTVGQLIDHTETSLYQFENDSDQLLHHEVQEIRHRLGCVGLSLTCEETEPFPWREFRSDH
jgi:DNA-directed RNA polymerase alpha subunit